MRSPGLRYWTTKDVLWQQSAYATDLVVVLCRFSGSRAGKVLAFSRPSRTYAWCGCLLVWSCSGWVSFSACVLSPYISSGIVLMSPPYARSSSCPSLSTNRYTRLFPFPPALRNLGSGGGEGCRSLIFYLWYPCVHKNIIRRVETILRSFLVYNLRWYCCEPSQRTGNRLVCI
jgi:hypothetical protein